MQHASLKCLESKSLFWEAVSLLGTLFPPSRQGFFYWAMACDACISHATRQVVPVLVQKKNSKFQTWYTSCADDMWKRGKLLCCKRGISCCCKKRIWSRHMESMQAVDWKAASSHKSQQRKTKHANHMLTIRKGTIFIWENCKYAMHWSLEVYGVLTRQFRKKKRTWCLAHCTSTKVKGPVWTLGLGTESFWSGSSFLLEFPDLSDCFVLVLQKKYGSYGLRTAFVCTVSPLSESANEVPHLTAIKSMYNHLSVQRLNFGELLCVVYWRDKTEQCQIIKDKIITLFRTDPVVHHLFDIFMGSLSGSVLLNITMYVPVIQSTYYTVLHCWNTVKCFRCQILLLKHDASHVCWPHLSKFQNIWNWNL